MMKTDIKQNKIGIIGLGYVGLPLAKRFVEVGFSVTGFDIDQEKVKLLSSKKTYIKHIPDEAIARMYEGGFSATTDFSKITDMDAILICVPTPLNKYREPDISYILSTMDLIQPHLRKNQMLSLESTTYPGTTEEELVSRIESKGFKVGEDFFVVYSPEREDPGNGNFTTQTIPKVLGGHTENCLQAGLAIYSAVIDRVVPVSTTRAAEMTKLLENIYRAVNIGLANEMKILADRMDIDIYEVIEAAASKPFGFTPYYPGPGVGGHCIPIDPFYLTWKAREYGMHTRFIELAGEINNYMPEYFINQIAHGLNESQKSLKGSKVLMLGISYKKNVDDARESPPIFMMEILRDRGADVYYSDPFFAAFPAMREHKFDLQSVELTPENIKEFDCVVLGTDHDQFDFDMIEKSSQLFIDTRGRTQRRKNASAAVEVPVIRKCAAS
ncbi:MAG: nucleotide sugar dehydrogenase [Alphaproteobacteria bacterium]